MMVIWCVVVVGDYYGVMFCFVIVSGDVFSEGGVFVS